ncbi:MAG: lipid-A-disaccharide synthase [Deltaproteobacteria bacterium]|jgi:lipid-A-disaccharide synthase|nr:lipid-A-disaccharide synthase [Deltaproteobacteria bacterium]
MTEPVRVMISAGELSGDMHGAALVREANKQNLGLKFFGLGGDRMAEAGVDLRFHIRETAVMGLTEVLGSLNRILGIRKALANMVREEKPRALVLIDSPDLNQALAKAAYGSAVPVIYYICPQIWAWRQGRIKWLKKLINRRAVLFPFEERFFQDHGVTADLVGHPLFDEMPLALSKEKARENLGLDQKAPLLAVLPGSRKKVASRLAGPMLEAVDLLLEKFPELVALIPRPATLPVEILKGLIDLASPRVKEKIKIFEGRSHEILKAADAALLASGTSTVEGAILGTPMVVTYKISALSWYLAKLLVQVPFVSIANLLVNREIVPELLQNRAKGPDLAQELVELIFDSPRRQVMIKDLNEAARLLGGPGASGRVLSVIMEEIEANKNTDNLG